MIQHTLILLGLSHAGKTTAGKLLASLLGCPFYDTDALIQQQTGLTPRELCTQSGIPAFHRAEAAALSSCCAAVQNGAADEAAVSSRAVVIAAGGGLCDNQEAAALLASIPHRIFLYAAESVLFERLTQDAQRVGCYPAFLQLVPAAQYTAAQQLFSLLYARRTAYYRQCCTFCIDTTHLTAAAVAQSIAAEYSKAV
ncbi:MAG: shikimate kinase [Treponema sp.]|uniref:shikimate kinase n=1 Tax=Treponema sp. TaxID=166 RepID=UPI003FA1AE57